MPDHPSLTPGTDMVKGEKGALWHSPIPPPPLSKRHLLKKILNVDVKREVLGRGLVLGLGRLPGCTPGSGGSLQVPPSRAALRGNSSGQLLHRGETSFPREAAAGRRLHTGQAAEAAATPGLPG